MHNQVLWNMLICPYCGSSFRYNWLDNAAAYGVARCLCDNYPIFDCVMYLKKSDSLLHRRAANQLATKHKSRALWNLLSDYPFSHRLATMIVYQTRVFFHFIIQLKIVILTMSVIGPGQSWFRYLLRSQTRNTLHTGATAITSVEGKRFKHNIIIDIGAGFGFLMNQLANKKKNSTENSFINIDKSFVSLFFAKQYRKTKKSLFVCSDVEAGMPIRSATATHVIFLDSFAWIYNKRQAIAESARTLVSMGNLIIVNVHQPLPSLSSWGYGISPTAMRQMMLLFFNRPTFFRNDTLGGKLKVVSYKNSDGVGFSCSATKK